MLLDAKQKAPGDAPVPRDRDGMPAGVLIDHGTGKRIPFPRKWDTATGDVEYLAPAPDGHNVLVDALTRKPVVRRYKAVGRLELVPLDRARTLGQAAAPPKPVVSRIETITPEQLQAGREQYRELFIWSWNWRGESRRCATERYELFMRENSLLDHYTIPARLRDGRPQQT